MSLMQELYDSEINASVSWFWDAGFEVKIGDYINGWNAEDRLDTWAQVEEWLTARAMELYPDSNFARRKRGDEPRIPESRDALRDRLADDRGSS